MTNDAPHLDIALRYARDTWDDKTICEETRLGCRRFLDDLESGAWDFRTVLAEWCIQLGEALFAFPQGELLDGTPLRGKPFTFMPWHVFCTYNICGFFLPGTEIRRYSEAAIFAPRKTVKTQWASSIIFALALWYRMSGSKQKTVAGSLKQGMESFDFLKYNLHRLGLTRDEDPRGGLRTLDSSLGHKFEGEMWDGYISLETLAYKALYDMTAQAAASADEIITLSAQTGLSTQSLQEFSYATELLDVSMDTLQGSLTKLTNNMQTAQKGTGDAAAAFDQLGVSVSDTNGNMRNAQDVFYEAIDALGEMENATERDALAMDIFGKSAQELNPLIIAGSGALREFAQEANETGYVLDDFALAKLGAVDDALQRLENSRETFTKNLAVQFAPTMEKTLGNASEMIKLVGDALEESGVVEAFGSILESASMLLVPVGELVSTLLPALTPALNVVAGVVALIADTLTVITGLLTFNGNLIKQGLGLTGNSAQNKLYYNSSGYTYDSASGSWKDPSVVTMADKRSQYDDWTRSGGAGTFEYWEQSIYDRNAAGTPN